MQDTQQLSGETEEQLWQQLEADLTKDSDTLEYRAILHQGETTFALDIDIDLGGGFESGYETTVFSASLDNPEGFQFGLHHHGFLDTVGKFLGMQDIATGDADFDAAVVVKASDEAHVKDLLADDSLRASLQTLENFTLELSLPSLIDSDHKHSRLALTVDEAVTEPAELRRLFDIFLRTLKTLK